jgi:hypothetical protein
MVVVAAGWGSTLHIGNYRTLKRLILTCLIPSMKIVHYALADALALVLALLIYRLALPLLELAWLGAAAV